MLIEELDTAVVNYLEVALNLTNQKEMHRFTTCKSSKNTLKMFAKAIWVKLANYEC